MSPAAVSSTHASISDSWEHRSPSIIAGAVTSGRHLHLARASQRYAEGSTGHDRNHVVAVIHDLLEVLSKLTLTLSIPRIDRPQFLRSRWVS